MTDYFTKARELGGLLLDSEEFARLRRLRDARDGGEAVEASAYASAEKNFAALLGQVIDIVRLTVWGDYDEPESANCVSCGGCADRQCNP
ncbi:MAG: hypothetical protein LBT44_10325 [Clostridiales bacterium]|nr:hypothetical protein [Clostridiales bacterium]